uniref:Sialic acid binding Ig-like lectin G n=1 Tax=Jaculus jaculus TaxID=51337 RepID=A0A8C5KA26_JACJA
MSLLLPVLLLLLGSEWVQGQQSQATDKYSLQVEKLVTVQEGLCVLVPCSFSSPKSMWPNSMVYGYWFTRGTNTDKGHPVATNNKYKAVRPRTKERFQLVGDPGKQDCSLMIRDVQREDSMGYFFRLEKSFDKYNFLDGFILQVEGLTQKPDIFIPATLEPGQPVRVLCVFNWAFEGCSAPSFSWRGAAASSQGGTPSTSYFSVLTFTPEPQHHNDELTCQVDFPRLGVSTQKTIRMNMAYAPKDLVISIFQGTMSGNISHLEDLKVHQGQALRLLCAAASEPPATLSWVLEDRVLSWSSPLGSRTLWLELPEVKAEDSGRYTCQAENRLGFQQRTLNLSVLCDRTSRALCLFPSLVLEILRKGCSLPVLEGQSLRLVCVTRSNPPARLSWTLESQTLDPTLSPDPGVLELPLVQWEHAGKFTCSAQNSLGAQYISLSLSVHYPPQMPAPSCSWEAEGLLCSCSSRAWPAPSLHWQLGEGLLKGNSSNDSITVTSSTMGPWANSSLSLHMGFSASFGLSCEAQNAHGVQRATVLLLPGQQPVGESRISKLWGSGVWAQMQQSMVIMKMLWKKKTQEQTSRPKILRGSTILDYINVVPKTRSLNRNRKAKPSPPPRTPPIGTHCPESKQKKNEPHLVFPGYPESKSPTQAPASENENDPEELHYAHLHFPCLRTQDTQAEYAEVRFH